MTSVVCGEISKQIRRVYVFDTVVDLDQVVTLLPGEIRVDIEDSVYRAFSDATVLHSYIADRIGVETNESRVIELRPDGLVVGVYSADPLIDSPVYDTANHLEYHSTAKVGDQVVNGEIIVIGGGPVIPPTTGGNA